MFVWFIRAHPGGRPVHSCSFLLAAGVVGFICVRLVNSSEPRGLFGFVWFIQARPGGRRVHSGSFGTFGGAPEVDGIISVRLLHSGVTLGLSGSFGFVGFIQARPSGRWVHSCWFGSFGRSPRGVGFIRVLLVHSCAPRV